RGPVKTLCAPLPATLALDDDLLLHADNAAALTRLPADAFDMAYADPPFNTGREQRRADLAYRDDLDDYLAFLLARVEHVRRVLPQHGTLLQQLDQREFHYVKVKLDRLFGRECFLNELIWAYDYGGKPRRRWPPKHDTILVYVKDRARYWFDDAEVDREPY